MQRLEKFSHYESATSFVIHRSVFLFLLFCNLVLPLMILSDVVPFKYEEHEGALIREGLWKLCIWFDYTYGLKMKSKCVDEAYSGDNRSEWYDAFRTLLVLATIMVFVIFSFCLLSAIVTKNTTKRNYFIPAMALVFTAFTFFVPIVLYHRFFPYDNIGDIREEEIGWTEETPAEEWFGENYYVTWSTILLTFLNSIVCLLVHKKDRLFVRECCQNEMTRKIMEHMRNGHSNGHGHSNGNAELYS